MDGCLCSVTELFGLMIRRRREAEPGQHRTHTIKQVVEKRPAYFLIPRESALTPSSVGGFAYALIKIWHNVCECRFLEVKASSGLMKRNPGARFQSEF